MSCKVNTELYLVCPDSSKKENHEIIAVNTDNQEACMEIWAKSDLFEFGALFQNCKVEAPRPGMQLYTVTLMVDNNVYITFTQRYR